MCTRCVMDTSATGISFDELGHCNYCESFTAQLNELTRIPCKKRERNLVDLLKHVKRQGLKKNYDCIVGVSGGIDSSWALLKAVELGLKPLAVHMDNGWDSELAQSNISNLVSRLNVDLYTHVIEWDEYRSMMEAFFAADVIDIEMLYDNAMLAVNYQQARVHGIKYILSGSNTVTEGMTMPVDWNWNKRDKRNIEGIVSAYGDFHLKSFPSISNINYYSNRFIREDKVGSIPRLSGLRAGKCNQGTGREGEFPLIPIQTL